MPPRALPLRRLAVGVLLSGLASCCFAPGGCGLPIYLPDASFLLDAGIPNVTGFSNLASVLDGGTGNFGVLQLVTGTENGVPTTTITVGPGGPTILTLTYPDALHTVAVGTSLNGGTDYYYESSSDGGVTQELEEEDTLAAGFFTQQNVRTIDTTGGLPYQIDDTRLVLLGPDGGPAASAESGTWTEAWTYAGPGEADADPSDCDGSHGFPSAYGSFDGPWPPEQPAGGGQLLQVLGTQIFILQDVGPGSCKAAGAKLLASVFYQAIGDVAAYLGNINYKKAALFAAAVGSKPLFVSCNNSCDGVNASTDLPEATWSNPGTYAYGARHQLGYVQRMSLNMTSLQQHGCGDPKAWEEVFIHELFHYAGVNHDPPPAGDPQGVDFVYCAGRYVSGLPATPETPGSDGSIRDNARDCAVAADNILRANCGIRMFVDDTQGSESAPDGVGCGCDTSHWAHAKSCDYNHDLPLIQDLDPAGECCEVPNSSPDACDPSPGCVPGWGWFGSLSAEPPPEEGDCVKLPVGDFKQLRTCQ